MFMPRYGVYFLFLVFGAFHVDATIKNGTCAKSTYSSVEKGLLLIMSLLDCKLTHYDVSDISMSVVSPKNLSQIEDFTTLEQFQAKGCCGKSALFTHHGYLENNRQIWDTELQRSYATATEGCAVAFDYHGATDVNYLCTVPLNVENVAKECARRVSTLFVKTGCLAPQNITYMGFSMGSEIAVRNAYEMIKTYNTAVGTIYATDPAGPIFNLYFAPPERFYYDEVAKNVSRLQCIHSTVLLGTDHYYLCPSAILLGPCKGSQSECQNIVFNAACDHLVTPSYLIESYKHPGSIVAKKCADCHFWQSHPSTCTTNTDVVGYQSAFKKGIFRHEHQNQCIDFYYD